MWIFYFLFWTAVRASAEEPLYRKIGDKVVLTPDSMENPITSIRWKHGPNIAMQWNGDETISYRQFKDRGSLNISTGVMTITGLTPDLSGIYTAEINGKETSETELLVFYPVPKPTLYVSCDNGMSYCIFTCSGSITDAEPVTYWWTAGEKRWNLTKELRITKEEEEQWFICTLENPVSSISSEKVFNPIMKSEQTWRLMLAAGVAVILFICIVMIIGSYKCRKRRKRKAVCTEQEEDADAVDGQEQDFKPQWQFLRRSGGWRDFKKMRRHKCSVTSDDIQEWYQEKPLIKMPFTVDGRSYEMDFDNMIQTNLKTKTKRKIRFVLLPPPSTLKEFQQEAVSEDDPNQPEYQQAMRHKTPEPESCVAVSCSDSLL